MTLARQVIPGRTYLLSRRATQRQFLLRPDDDVEEIYLYCLAEAAERYGITLHGFIAMSNHQHIVVRDNHGNYPEFLCHLDKMISKVMNAHLKRSENFWATEQPNAVYLVEPVDRFAKLVYLLANPVAGDLVDRISDWPGASSYAMHLSGRTSMTVKRPRCTYFGPKSRMPTEVTLRIERPEGFEELSEAEWTTKLTDALAVEENRARDERIRNGRGVVGRKTILLTDPTDKPTTIKPRGGLRPTIACRNAERRIHELMTLVGFRIARHAARIRALAAERDVIFPFGTYRVRGFFLSAPPPIALAA